MSRQSLNTRFMFSVSKNVWRITKICAAKCEQNFGLRLLTDGACKVRIAVMTIVAGCRRYPLKSGDNRRIFFVCKSVISNVCALSLVFCASAVDLRLNFVLAKSANARAKCFDCALHDDDDVNVRAACCQAACLCSCYSPLSVVWRRESKRRIEKAAFGGAQDGGGGRKRARRQASVCACARARVQAVAQRSEWQPNLVVKRALRATRPNERRCGPNAAAGASIFSAHARDARARTRGRTRSLAVDIETLFFLLLSHRLSLAPSCPETHSPPFRSRRRLCCFYGDDNADQDRWLAAAAAAAAIQRSIACARRPQERRHRHRLERRSTSTRADS